MALRPIPEGFHTVTPYLSVENAPKIIEFMEKAFDAQQLLFHDLGGGHVHAEVRIGDSVIMLGQSAPLPAQIYLYVDDVDATYQRALQAGAKSVEAPNDKPYGDRGAWVTDPFANTWFIATHKEEVSEQELLRRFAAARRK